jgi:hypothetical protein
MKWSIPRRTFQWQRAVDSREVGAWKLHSQQWAPLRYSSLQYITKLYSVQILGNNECFEPYTSNIYVRRTLSGEFTVVNQHLLMDLTSLGFWSADLKNELVAANGSVQVPLHSCVIVNLI